MKKITIIVCAICLWANAKAQPAVRIGNMEIIIKKAEGDTLAHEKEPCPPCPPVDNKQPKPQFKPYKKTHFFCGLSAIVPDNSSNDYYTTLGGNSFNIDAGFLHGNAITRWLALCGTFQYSFYNYSLRDAASDESFAKEVTGSNFHADDIRQQQYLSHNFAASAFTRFYLTNHNSRRITQNRVYIDLGAQGDFAIKKFFQLNTQQEGKRRYYEDYVFNPFTVSAIARIGMGGGWAIFARYRITNAFNPKALPMDLPPLSIGINFM